MTQSRSWFCSYCGGYHGPHVDTCPASVKSGASPPREDEAIPAFGYTATEAAEVIRGYDTVASKHAWPRSRTDPFAQGPEDGETTEAYWRRVEAAEELAHRNIMADLRLRILGS
jgi:hypothetical protein